MRRPDHDRRKLVTAVRMVKHGLRVPRHRGGRIAEVHGCLTANWRRGLIEANAALQNVASKPSAIQLAFLIIQACFARLTAIACGGAASRRGGHRPVKDKPGTKFAWRALPHGVPLCDPISVDDAAADQANPEASCH